MTFVEDLKDWQVTVTLTAGGQRRDFTLVVPAFDEKGAQKAALGIALAINEGSEHVWKTDGTFTAEPVQ